MHPCFSFSFVFISIYSFIPYCICLPIQTVADPHNATRGFFFAHMGWLFVKKHPAIVEAGKKLNFDDLANDSTVTFQKKLGEFFFFFLFSHFLVFSVFMSA